MLACIAGAALIALLRAETAELNALKNSQAASAKPIAREPGELVH